LAHSFVGTPRPPVSAEQDVVGADGGRTDFTARGCILLVDDEQAIRSSIGRALTGEGHTVDFAQTGSEGLGRALAQSYDLVILDLLMPDTDGTTVLRRLLRDPAAQAVTAGARLSAANS